MANARNARMTARAIAPPFFLTLEVGLELTLALTELECASASRESSGTFDTTSDIVVVVIGEVVEGAVVVEAVTEEVADGRDVILCTLVVVEDGEVVETFEVLELTASAALADWVVVVVVVMVVLVEDSMGESAAFASLLQFNSSEESSQSGVPSQTQVFGIQLPSPQWNTVASSAHVEIHVVLSKSKAIPKGHLHVYPA